jgi:hypothetical protein
VAVVIEVIKAKAIEENEAKEIVIKTEANIEVKDAALEVEEEVIIALIIGYCH